MHFSESKIQLYDAIFVDSDDVASFKRIKELNVNLEVRMVPTDSRKDIFKAIKEKIEK